jgi:hypothetical protein
VECARRRKPNGQWVYEASQSRPDDQIQLKCNFPAIREGDMPLLVKAIAEAMTLDNKGGQVVGIDERTGVQLLAETLGLQDYGDVLDKQYPLTGEDKYDPSRTKEPEPPPVPKLMPNPGGLPQAPDGNTAVAPPTPQAAPVAAAERFLRALDGLKETTHNGANRR